MSVLDPGFEIPALSAGTQWDAPTAGPPVFPPGSPWEFHVGGGSASGIASNGAPIVGTAGAAPDGHQVLYLQHGAKVLQDFTLSAPLAGPVSFFASLNGPTGSLTSGQVYIDVWSGATHLYSQFATISHTVGYQRYTLPELDLAPGAYEIGVTFVGDTDSDVLVDAIAFTLPPNWLRLVHESGTSWVQQDGTRVQLRANNTEVLHLPLPTLSSASATLVGQDPSTGLPAFCPPPPVVQIAPAPSAPPTPSGVPANEFRCNIAQYVAGQMATAYGVAAAKVLSLNTTENTLVALGGPLAATILGLLDVVFPPLLIVTAFAIPFIVLLANYQESATLLPLGGPAQDAIAHALYCALQADASGQYPIDGTTLFNWSYNLTTFGSSFSGNQLAEVRLLITVYQEEYWHNLALQAGQQGSTLCAGYDCTGLLP